MQETITALLGEYGYGGVFFLIAVENLFPPIPSEVILTFGGFLTTVTSLTLWGVIWTSTAGSVAGAAVLYGAGRLLSPQRLSRLLDSKACQLLHLQRQDIEKAVAWFAARGKACVFYGRCVPILRSLVSVPAGMAGMPLVPFFTLTTLGSLVWNIVLVHLGAFAGENWPKVNAFFASASAGTRTVLWAGLALGIALVLYKRLRGTYNLKKAATQATTAKK